MFFFINSNSRRGATSEKKLYLAFPIHSLKIFNNPLVISRALALAILIKCTYLSKIYPTEYTVYDKTRLSQETKLSVISRLNDYNYKIPLVMAWIMACQLVKRNHDYLLHYDYHNLSLAK